MVLKSILLLLLLIVGVMLKCPICNASNLAPGRSYSRHISGCQAKQALLKASTTNQRPNPLARLLSHKRQLKPEGNDDVGQQDPMVSQSSLISCCEKLRHSLTQSGCWCCTYCARRISPSAFTSTPVDPRSSSYQSFGTSQSLSNKSIQGFFTWQRTRNC